MTPPSHHRRRILKGLAGALGLASSRPGSALEGVAPASCPIALLPQNDPDPLSRERQLERARERYVYDFDKLPSLPMAERVPAPDGPSAAWVRQGLSRVRDLVRNFAAGPRRRPRRDRPESIEDYEDLFQAIALPPIADSFRDDRVFARQRVAGANPLVLARMRRRDERFPLTEAMYRSVLPGDRLSAALREGRLYLADYALLAGVEPGQFRGAAKFVSAPLALFAVKRGSDELVPVAIQCDQTPGRGNPIFLPHDAHGWTMAKTVVQIADANFHEAVSHLGRTHLFIEPFVIATERHLAEGHPLRRLLRPHFEGTLFINELAYSRLLRPGGFVDELLAGTIDESIRLAAEGVRSYSFDEAMLPSALRARGVADPETLPSYPYRDDALLYWDAIRDWAEDYLRLYYRTETDLVEDFELAAWYRELVSWDGGRVRGFGDGVSIGGIEALIEAATLLVFTSSVQHAAVNFPQFDLMTYVPNMPLAGFAPAPGSGVATEQDWLNLLPPLSSARRQLVILYLLGTVHHTQLGAYSSRELCDARLDPALDRFRKALTRIGQIIEDRNRLRPPYRFLEPRGIPQSINI